MYMANAKILHWGPNATYIPPVRVGGWHWGLALGVGVGGWRWGLALAVGIGGNANFNVRVGGDANFIVFRYQHVGIANATLWRWGSKLTRGPNTNGFASQWNIG